MGRSRSPRRRGRERSPPGRGGGRYRSPSPAERRRGKRSPSDRRKRRSPSRQRQRSESPPARKKKNVSQRYRSPSREKKASQRYRSPSERKGKSQSKSGSRSRSGSAQGSGEEEDTKKRGEDEKMDMMLELPVEIEGADPKKWGGPIASWDDAVERKIISKEVVDIVKSLGLKKPTQVQREVLPIALYKGSHFDMVASAETGSGKTFAFCIPLLQRLLQMGDMSAMRPFFPGASAQGMPMGMVLSPTRELAIQTDKELQRLTKGKSIRCVCVFGGEPINSQKKLLEEKQTDVICGTPGRVLDLIDANKLSLSFVGTAIIDEADQMLDQQGLEKIVNEVMHNRDLPEQSLRQTLLFSATIPAKVQEIMEKSLREAPHYCRLKIARATDETGGSVAHIKQEIKWAPDDANRTQMFVRAVIEIYGMRVRESQSPIGAKLQAARKDLYEARSILFTIKKEDTTALEQQKRLVEQIKDSISQFERDLKRSIPSVSLPEQVKPGTLNSKGYPLRPGAKICEFAQRTGECRYGEKCTWDHPERPKPHKPLGGGVPPCRIVAFSNRRKQAEVFTNALTSRGFYADHLHGKMEQWERTKAVDDFQKTDFGVIVATNVAARGLDFDDTRFVFQLDLPEEICTYTHRIGRTGRIGNEGTAIAYMGPKDQRIAKELAELLQLNGQEVPQFVEDLAERPEPDRRFKGKGKGRW